MAISTTEWIERCARRLTEVDPALGAAEARELAVALHAFERTRALDPVAAVDFVASELDQPEPRFERRARPREGRPASP